MLSRTSSETSTASSSFAAGAGSSSKRTRRKLSPDQLDVLEKSYEENAYPDETTRDAVAGTIAMDVKTVSIWFQNKRQADRKAALHSATSAANAGLAPPPVAISRPGRKHDSLRKRPARKSASPIDDEDDEGAATERERDSATPPALLERAASFSAAEPPSNAAPRAPLARTASLPASNAHARAGPGFQGRTGLVYHVYPVPYAPPPAFYPPAMMGAYSTEPPSRTYSTEPFSRTPSLASTVSTSSPLTPPPPRKRKAVSMWDAMPSSSPSSALAQAPAPAPRGQKRRTLEWACERARVHEDEPGAEDDDELRNAALLLCGLRGAR